METSERSLKLLAGVFTSLLVLTTLGTIYYWDHSGHLTRENNYLSQGLDSLGANNIRLLDEHRRLTAQLAAFQEENKALSEQAQETKGLLSQRNKHSNELQKHHTLWVREQKNKQDSLQWQLANLYNQTIRMENVATSLEKEIATLRKQMQHMAPKRTLTADGFRVEALKANNQVTAKAKKVDELLISFIVPQELGLQGNQDIYLSLTDLTNKAIPTPKHRMIVDMSDQSRLIPVHTTKKVDFTGESKRVSISFAQTNELKPGTYRASVFTRDTYLGAVEFEVRDSFWFF